MSTPELIKAIAVTAELTQTALSPAAARVMAMDLSPYPEAQVFGALEACRLELKGKLTTADVLSRLADGRPGPEEAWSIVASSLTDESVTVVRTDEMVEAFGAALPLADDPIAARMAFKEVYARALLAARRGRLPIKWQVSLGHSASGRASVLLDAVEKGRIKLDYAQRLLPNLQGHPHFERLLGEMKLRLGKAAA